MNRLERKCVVVSAGAHLLLLLLLLVGSAFRANDKSSGSASPAAARGPEIQIIPPSPQFEPPSPALPQIRAPRQPNPAPVPAVAPQIPAPDAPPASLNPQRPVKPSLPQVSTNFIYRPTKAPLPNRPANPGVSSEQMGQEVDHVFNSLSGGTSINLTSLPGPGPGPKDSEYARIVREKYSERWDPLAAGATCDRAVTQVTVTIARDGKVISALILKPSGDPGTDDSVRAVLKRVDFIEPFEPSATEKQRTYTINFNLRMLGPSF